MPETFETTWPGKSFAQFGGHVLERLLALDKRLRLDESKRYTVRVTIETLEIETPNETTGNVASDTDFTLVD